MLLVLPNFKSFDLSSTMFHKYQGVKNITRWFVHLTSTSPGHSQLASTSHGHSHLAFTLCGHSQLVSTLCGHSHLVSSLCRHSHLMQTFSPHIHLTWAFSPCIHHAWAFSPHVHLAWAFVTSFPSGIGARYRQGDFWGVYVKLSPPPHKVTLHGHSHLTWAFSPHVHLTCSPPRKNNIFCLVWKNFPKSHEATPIPSIGYLLRATKQFTYIR